jgi:outer membrane protein assembly factor BamB
VSRLKQISLGLLIVFLLSTSASARVLWRRSLEPWSAFRSKTVRPEKTPPLWQDGKIYAVSSRGRYVVLDADSGRRLVKLKLKFRASSGLLVQEGRVYFGSDTGELVCLDAASGSLLWTYTLKIIDISPPIIAGDFVIFQTGLDAVTALNKTTGEWAWTYQHHRISDIAIMGMSAPAADEQLVHLGTSDGYLLALHWQDGSLAWKKQLFSKGNFRDIDAGLVTDETTIFASDYSGETAAVSRRSGDKYWDFQAGGLARPVLSGGTLYIAGRDGRVVALDKKTGLKQWETEIEKAKKIVPETRLLTPALYKQWLIVPNLQGKIFFLDPTTGKVEQTIHLFKSISVPIQAGAGDDGLYLFSNKGIIYKMSY